MTIKICSGCKVEKETLHFHKCSRNGFQSRCKDCRSTSKKDKVPDGKKKCTACKHVKDIDDFYTSGKYRQSKCKKCSLNYCASYDKESMTKRCSSCKETKSVNLFHKSCQGYARHCKDCRSIYQKANRDKANKRTKKYDTSSKGQSRRKQYAEDNKEKLSAYQKEYRKDNADKIRKQKTVYIRERRRTDPGYRLLGNCRKRVYDALKGRCKSARTKELLGCSIEDYKAYLESKFQEGMTWDNYGRGGWVVDHIMPCAAFDLSRPDQQKECFVYTNTQPLWEQDNIVKSDHI